MHRYIEYGEQDKWGKRKQPALSVDTWASEVLANANSAKLPATEAFEFGLDVHGPGGGQFTLNRPAGGDLTIIAGLADRNMPTLEITTEELQQLQSNSSAMNISDPASVQALKSLQAVLSGITATSSVS